MRYKSLGIAALLVFCIILAAAPAFALTEEETLQVLAHQAFMKCHQKYVTLPSTATERISRSSLQIPPQWPDNMKGLVLEEYFNAAFAQMTLAQLDAGVEVAFVKENEYIVYAIFKRNSEGEVNALRQTACTPTGCIAINPNSCEDGEDTELCTCNGTHCDNCTSGAVEFNHNQEGDPEVGDTYTSTNSPSTTKEVCGVNTVGGTVISVILS